ncbi:MAG TPA: hypothetical protein ENK57_09075 [Polyangiaceae bacterium]|nr:hypothetical protein [Polyangiaceae bacterium]
MNELRFEDRAGDEHLAVTAARDLREITVLNRRVTVRNDENREVGEDRIEVVGVLESLRVDQRFSQSVARAHNLTVGHDRHVFVAGNVSLQVQQDLELNVTQLYFSQIGEGISGVLFSPLRAPVHSPADTVVDALADLLEPSLAAVEEVASETGAGEPLWAEQPDPSATLGAVMGRLTDPPSEEPEEEGDSSGEAQPPGDSGLGDVLGAVGDIAEGAAAVAAVVDGAAGALDSLDSGVGGVSSLGALGGDTDWAAATGLVGGVLAEVIPEEVIPDELGPVLGVLQGVAALATGSEPPAKATAQVVGGVASLALGAAGLGADPNALQMVSGVSELAGVGGVSDVSGALSSVSGADDDPLGFLSVLSEPAGSPWDGIASTVGDINAVVQGIAAAASLAEAAAGQEPEPAFFRPGGAHPHEREAMHFAATVAAAWIRGEVHERGFNSPEEDAEDDEAETTESGETTADDSAGGDSAGDDSGASDTRDTEPPEAAEDEEEEAIQPQGRGTWSVDVAGATTENVAGIVVEGTAGDMRTAVGGDSTSTIRLAHVEQIGESRAEVVQGNKTESADRFAVTAPEGIELHSGGTLRMTVNGDATYSIAGARTLTSADSLELSGANLALNATETVTFECGAARVSVSADGIAIEGTEITIRGDDIGVDSPALG